MTANVTSSAGDLILGGLLNINAFSPGQPLNNEVGSTGMQVLNDLLDSLSQDQDFIYTQTLNQFSWVPGQYQYTVGNPVGGTFAATITAGSNVLTNVVVPSNIALGGTLTDSAGALPAGTEVIGANAALNTVTVNFLATKTPGVPVNVTFTTPGNWPIERPLRIRNSFTRVTTSAAAGLDYFIDVISFDRYNEIGLKTVPGPWPYVMAYQPTFPLGTLWIYPNPTIAGSAFLYTDLILSNFVNLTDPVNLPQGYARALKKLLALELAPVFGKVVSPQLTLQAKEARALIKGLNAAPVVTLRYDSDLIYSRHTDASWIVTGGFV